MNKAMETLKNMSVEQLIEQWEMVSKMKMTEEIPTVRGWILEALEEKTPNKMNQYYSDFYEDEDLRTVVLG